MKYPEDYLKECRCAKASEGLSWYEDFLNGEDVGEPPREKLLIWVGYAAEVLRALEDHPEAKEIIDYA